MQNFIQFFPSTYRLVEKLLMPDTFMMLTDSRIEVWADCLNVDFAVRRANIDAGYKRYEYIPPERKNHFVIKERY